MSWLTTRSAPLREIAEALEHEVDVVVKFDHVGGAKTGTVLMIHNTGELNVHVPNEDRGDIGYYVSPDDVTYVEFADTVDS